MFRARIRRTKDGRFSLRLGEDERALLARLPGEMRELLAGGDDPALQRLFPPAYVSEAEHEAEYRKLMGGDLAASHVAALDVMEATANADELDIDQLTAWMRALNEIRLVLGTRLDVSEEDDWFDVDDADPRAPAYALYGYLGALQVDVVDALSQALP